MVRPPSHLYTVDWLVPRAIIAHFSTWRHKLHTGFIFRDLFTWEHNRACVTCVNTVIRPGQRSVSSTRLHMNTMPKRATPRNLCWFIFRDTFWAVKSRKGAETWRVMVWEPVCTYMPKYLMSYARTWIVWGSKLRASSLSLGTNREGWQHSPEAIWILQPDSSWILEICSPPFPMTRGGQKEKRPVLSLSKFRRGAVTLTLSRKPILTITCRFSYINTDRNELKGYLLNPTILSGTL